MATSKAEEEMADLVKLIEPGNKLEPMNDRVQVQTEGSNRVMKMISLMLLTPQYAVLILLMRYVRTRPGDMFVTSTTVFLAEVAKTLMCFLIILVQQGGVRSFCLHVYEFLICRPRDFMKVCVPSLLFVLQNNLIFVAVSNLDAAMFQVTYQLKILTTAVFSVVLLGKRLSVVQWFSLLVLFIGVSIIQVKSAMGQMNSPAKSTHSLEEGKEALPELTKPSPTPSAIHAPEQNHFTGLMAVLACCCLSGFANVFFEMLLKGGKQSVWMRNIQLGLSGAVLGAVACLAHDGRTLRDQGFFFGYDSLVWGVIILQSLGGLLVAAVIKYADNILKGFSTAGSILLSCLASVYIFNFQMDMVFILGTSLVITALYLYTVYPPVQPVAETKELDVVVDTEKRLSSKNPH